MRYLLVNRCYGATVMDERAMLGERAVKVRSSRETGTLRPGKAEYSMPIRFTPNVFTSRHFEPRSGPRPTFSGRTWDILAPAYAHFGPIVGLDEWLGR